MTTAQFPSVSLRHNVSCAEAFKLSENPSELGFAVRSRPLEPEAARRLNDRMASRESAQFDITPEVLLKAYSCGIFPMAESAEDPALYWIEPARRGIIPLDRFHVPERLARTVRSDLFSVVVDRDFDAVIDACAEPMPGRSRTWFN